MATDYEFEGWMGEDESSAEGNMVWQKYEPKTWEETDVDIRITHCGICGSDMHVLRSEWVSLLDVYANANTGTEHRDCRADPVFDHMQRQAPYPVVVGHEIVGVGGLGHFAVLFAKALGADDIVGISRRASKKQEALDLGCTDYIATADDEGWETKNARRLDLIICTVSSAKMPFAGYIGLLRLDGTLVQVGLPEGELPFRPGVLTGARRRIAGSGIGSPSEIREMLQLAVDKDVKPWVEERPMSDANQALVDFEAGKPRFRYVLTN
ncbi:uncharacterized protein VDAG_08959 [Verticillium dahliae VdLs.17]|uniref:Alcohol dehydrogenase-like C-terminal domain-containing protein n=1 Tax=Verticillium dahliae (strain VdLs.17 / ATCC MYA-4575 / FGSC 10137) TaxID=498257 RepID=G2XFY0_VERDV|nr:uncharacterized protein VDAG_08959 [Verticillium dahliae VdLs.17]EGY18799.1 hypothetical protein VDAG_08959 [Verticillium dahliae VdLs.17]KAF3350469.1 hypothetical protein VdG2_01468 [Verticillium dahliae VDG2]KAH6702498.1 hypothetical protein EV126DRAFT_441425 [Verticillium dahliae]